MIVVGDSSVLIALERIQAQELLPRLYGEVHVPDAVWREVFLEKDSGRRPPAPAWLIRHPLPARPQPATWIARLDAGEIEAILLARQMPADLLLIDEIAGRRVARRLGLRVTGVIGVLIEAKRRGEIAWLAPHLHQLRLAGFFLSDALEASALRDAGESG